MDAQQKVRVRFAVSDDEQANKITALLEALGYEAVRELEHDSSVSRLRWAVTRLAKLAQLTEREREILARVLHGQGNAQIAQDLEISKATVKWHMHNLFTKSGTTCREGLLRVALQLGGYRSRPAKPQKTPPAEDPPDS